MENIKHTPGPWLMNTTKAFIENPNGLAITDDKHRLIASVSHDLQTLSIKEYEANAKLIAAAPDMLEVFKIAFRLCDKRQMPTEEELNILKIDLQNAIKKATE